MTIQPVDSDATDSGSSRFRSLATALKCSLVHPGFNMQMIYAAVAVLGVSIAGFNLTHVHFQDTGNMVLALAAYTRCPDASFYLPE